MSGIVKMSDVGGQTNTLPRYLSMLAGDTAYNPSAMILIQNTTLTSTQDGITFTSIPQIYQHLRIIINAKGAGSTYYYGHTYLRFNNDSGSSSYGGIKNQAFSVDWTSSISAFGSYPANTLDVGYYVDSQASIPNRFGTDIIDIPNYSNSTQNKNTISNHGFITGQSTGQDYTTSGFATGTWFNTSAINQIFVNNYGSQWAAGTTVSLYGLKG